MTSKNNDYEIGYKKPPIDKRFKQGQSGNRAGRPKGVRNFKTDVCEQLNEPVSVREGGTVRTMSSQQAALMQLRADALGGNQRARTEYLGYGERYAIEEAADDAETALSGEDEAIIERFIERTIEERAASPSSGPVPGEEEAGDE